MANNKIGYVSSLYIKLDLKKSIKGKVIASKIKVRKSANSKSAYVKNSSGNIISLKKDKAVNIIDEAVVSGEKWYKISFTVSKVKYSGYVPAYQIGFRGEETKNTSAPTPTPTPKPKATPTPKPTATPTPKPKATPTPKPKATPTPVPTPEDAKVLEIKDNPIYSYIYGPIDGFVCNILYLNVYENRAVNDNFYMIHPVNLFY